MTRLLSGIAALAITASALTAVVAGTGESRPVRTVSADAQGQPLLLKRMTVTATPLP